MKFYALFDGDGILALCKTEQELENMKLAYDYNYISYTVPTSNIELIDTSKCSREKLINIIQNLILNSPCIGNEILW